MKKSFKKIAASLMAAAMLVTGMTGIVSSAADINEEPASIASEDAARNRTFRYSFSDVGQDGRYLVSPVIPIANPTDIDISFGAVTSSTQALVTVVNTNDHNDTYGNFIMPTYAGATLHTYISLPAGNYCFFVTPYGGDWYSTTSGSFTVRVV